MGEESEKQFLERIEKQLKKAAKILSLETERYIHELLEQRSLRWKKSLAKEPSER